MSTTKSIRGTKTEQNLLIAYLSESAAYTRYIFYAQQADKENYYPIGVIFRATADNELHHAKIYFKYLQGGTQLTVPVPQDLGIIGTTAQNLALSVKEETDEDNDYLEYAKVAREEGFDDIAAHFEAIASVEQRHGKRFQHFLDQVNAGTVWKRETPVKWQCLVCGYIYEGTTPPEVCPACNHPYQHYIALDYDNI